LTFFSFSGNPSLIFKKAISQNKKCQAQKILSLIYLIRWELFKVEHELASAEFLVCQDIFPNETTKSAYAVFPAAAWSENDGTFANSERRVAVCELPASPGLAMPNWCIFKQLAKRKKKKRVRRTRFFLP
jgi:NADH dehydrogenase/NADH:ubiquinone oxidoreductase subunit G